MGSSKMVKRVAKGGAAPKIAFPRSAVVAKKRTFSIGGDILPKKRDLTRFVRWPKYVRLQRSKMTLLKRIKIPPAINKFSNSFDKRQASQLFRHLNNLKPETKTERSERLKEQADKVAAGGKVAAKKPNLVIIAHDVDPIEIVVWLPSLCKARGIPYCIVKSKARLGAVVGMKTATCLAITDVKPENKGDLASVIQMAEANFNDVHDDAMRKWGDAQPSGRQLAATAKRGIKYDIFVFCLW